MMRNRGRHEKYFHPNFSFVPSVALAEFSLLIGKGLNYKLLSFMQIVKVGIRNYLLLSTSRQTQQVYFHFN